jgi:hypothetical protein
MDKRRPDLDPAIVKMGSVAESHPAKEAANAWAKSVAVNDMLAKVGKSVAFKLTTDTALAKMGFLPEANPAKDALNAWGKSLGLSDQLAKVGAGLAMKLTADTSMVKFGFLPDHSTKATMDALAKSISFHDKLVQVGTTTAAQFKTDTALASLGFLPEANPAKDALNAWGKSLGLSDQLAKVGAGLTMKLTADTRLTKWGLPHKLSKTDAYLAKMGFLPDPGIKASMDAWAKSLGLSDHLAKVGTTAASAILAQAGLSKASLTAFQLLGDASMRESAFLSPWNDAGAADDFEPSITPDGQVAIGPAPRTVQAIGLCAYQVEVFIFLMLVIWMLSVKADGLFAASTSLSDRAIALTEILAVAALPKVSVIGVREFIAFLRG